MNHSGLYSCSDAVFMRWVFQSITLIKEEKARFWAFSVLFTPEKIQEIEVLYDELSRIPSDKEYDDIQAQSTEDVKACVEACASFYQVCKFDIVNVFPNMKHIWDQFGFNDLEAARKSGRGMLLFYSDFILIAHLHKEAMIEAVWTEETFTKIAELKDELKMNLDQQSKCFVDRACASDKRHICLNTIYVKLANYMKAAKSIYMNHEGMLRWFMFPVMSKASKDESIEQEAQGGMV